MEKNYTENHGWMDDLPFHVLFNNISVISGQWVDYNESLCAMETCVPNGKLMFLGVPIFEYIRVRILSQQ